MANRDCSCRSCCESAGPLVLESVPIKPLRLRRNTSSNIIASNLVTFMFITLTLSQGKMLSDIVLKRFNTTSGLQK